MGLKDAKTQAGSRTNWDDAFKAELVKLGEKGERLRLWDVFVKVPVHQFKFKSTQSGNITGYSERCLNWDYEKQKEIEGGCPACKEGIQIGADFYAFVLNRRAKVKANEIIVKPVRLTGVTVNKLTGLSDKVYMIGDEDVDDARLPLPEGFTEQDPPTADDHAHGFDVRIKKTTNNKKTEYECETSPAWAVPLDEEDIAAFQEVCALYPIAKFASKGRLTPAAMAKKMADLGITKGGPSNKPAGKSQAEKDDDAFADDTVPADEDEAPKKAAPKAAAAKPAVKPAAGKPATVKKAALSEDDDENVHTAAAADASDAPADEEDPF